MAERRKLYEIADEYREMVAEVQTGDVPMDELHDRAAAIRETQTEMDNKVEACMRARRNLEIDADIMLAEAKVLQAEIDRLKKAAAARKNEAGRLNDYVAFTLESCDRSQVKTNIGTVFLRRTKRMEIGQEAKIPDEYLKRTVSVDKAALRKAVEAGEFADEHVNIVESTGVGIR